MEAGEPRDTWWIVKKVRRFFYLHWTTQTPQHCVGVAAGNKENAVCEFTKMKVNNQDQVKVKLFKRRFFTKQA